MSDTSRTGFGLLDSLIAPQNSPGTTLPVAAARPVKPPTLFRRSLYREKNSYRDLTNAEDIDSYFSQTISRHAELVWKKGYTLDSKNPDAAKYIDIRFRGMEIAMDRPIKDWLHNITRHFIHYGDCYTVAKRSRTMKLPPVPGVLAQGSNGRTPIIGLFEMDPPTVTPVKNDEGIVTSYTQSIDGQSKDFSRGEIITFSYRRKPHESRGRSMFSPVLADLDAYRIMEDRFMLLLQKYLFPLTLYRVGVGRQRKVSDAEIQKAISTIEQMPPDATLVVEGDHEVQSTGAESKAIRAEGYAKIFQNRLFSGLGMSEVQFGIGQNVTRSSGELITAELHDKVMIWQTLIDMYISFYVIKELLIEGGFDPINNPKDRVFFKFPPVSDDEKYKNDANAIQLWQNDGITIDQYWEKTGHKPPTEKDWKRTRYSMVQRPLAELSAKKQLGNSEPSGGASNTAVPANQYSSEYTNSLEMDLPTQDFIINSLTLLVEKVESLAQDVRTIEETI